MEERNQNNKIVTFLIITNILAFIVSGFLGFELGKKQLTLVPQEGKNISQEKKINMVKDYMDKNYLRDIDEEKLFEGQLKGMVSSLEDPYSYYLTADELDKLKEDTIGKFGGIGVVVSPGDDGFITVVAPIEGSPGDRAGILSGDRIFKVEGQEFMAENMEDAVKKMRGEIGTDVEITILRGKNQMDFEKIELTLTREEIKSQTVNYEVLDDNVGYLRITSFDEGTHESFKEALGDLKLKGVKGVVIDLRNNPGGVLDGTAKILDELLPKADIVYTETKDGTRKYIKSNQRHVDIPIAVLINGGSASASEIFAGAIQDNDRGKIIGTTSFGKGVVQRINDFPDGSGIKLTISEFFTPKGNKIHGEGVKPDIEVELDEDVIYIGPDNLKDDKQLKKAIEILK